MNGALRPVGLIGGMSWESTALYYRALNVAVRDRLGGLHSAPVLLSSLDFAPVAALQAAGDWPALATLMVVEAQRLEQAGATAILIGSNTMHEVADAVEAAAGVPLLHIADAAGAAAQQLGGNVRRVGLLGTAFTMERAFYRERLAARFGLETLVPGDEDRARVHAIIYEELVRGIVTPESRAVYRDVMAQLVARGAETIVLGCTEITLLVGEADAAVPLLDTAALHAAAGARWAMGEGC